MAAYATLADLEARFPRALTTAEEEQAPTMLDDASFLLSIQAPTLQAAIDTPDLAIVHATMLLVVAMVKRAILANAAQGSVDPNVDNLTESFGPFSQSIKYRSPNSNLYLYDSEWEYLLALLRGNVATAVSVRSPGL